MQGSQRHMHLRFAAPLVIVLALAGCTSRLVLPSSPRASVHQVVAPGPVTAVNTPNTATLSRGDLATAQLAVVSGATTVTVVTAALPGQLLQARTPQDSSIRPQFVFIGGNVQLFLDGTGQSGPAAVQIVLSSAVTWQLQFSGGASQTVLDLSGGKVSGLDFTAGSSLITMALPRPRGTVTITLAGGSSQVSLGVPAGVRTRLQLYGGASTATLGGHTYSGISGGTVLTQHGWARASSRYDVDATAGVSAISATS